MSLFVNEEEISEAYADVRNDNTDTAWLLLGYDDKSISLRECGVDYDELFKTFDETIRAYAFVRVESGDELSKRAKFVFITWIGNIVSPIKKAKVNFDSASVKKIIENFAVEIRTEDREDVEYESLRDRVAKAGGANYGTGE